MLSSKNRKASNLKTRKGPALRKLTKRQKQYLAIQVALRRLLRSASPKSKERDIRWVSIDLAWLCEVASNHQRHIRLLIKCSYPKDRERIENLLTEILVNLLSQGASHLSTLKMLFPRLRSAIYAHAGGRSSSRVEHSRGHTRSEPFHDE